MDIGVGDQKHYICGQRELQNSGINIGVGKEKTAVCVFSYGKQALLKKKNHNRTCFFLLRFSYYLLQDSTFADVFQQVGPTNQHK